MSIVEQAGAIPFTVSGNRPRILLVRARRAPSEWIFPKGHIEPGEDAATAAVRELMEEGGVQGTVVDYAGSSRFRSGDEDVNVSYFLVRYEGEPEGGEERGRAIFDLDDALSALKHPDARRLLSSSRTRIERAASEQGT